MTSKATKLTANRVGNDNLAPVAIATASSGERYYNRELSWLKAI